MIKITAWHPFWWVSYEYLVLGFLSIFIVKIRTLIHHHSFWIRRYLNVYDGEGYTSCQMGVYSFCPDSWVNLCFEFDRSNHCNHFLSLFIPNHLIVNRASKVRKRLKCYRELVDPFAKYFFQFLTFFARSTRQLRLCPLMLFWTVTVQPVHLIRFLLSKHLWGGWIR